MEATLRKSKVAGMSARAWIAGGLLWAAAGAISAEHGWRFVTSELLWIVSDVLLLVGLLALGRLRPHGDSRVGSAALVIALVGRLTFFAAELVCLATFTADNALLPMGALLTALSMLTYGVSVARRSAWTGWTRFGPLTMGVYPFVVMFPLLAITGEPNVAAISGWGIAAVVLGLATQPARHKDAADDTVIHVSRKFALVFVVVAAVLGGLASEPASAQPNPARVIAVPRDFRTIQAAVAAARPGDTVAVGRGTYTEEVVIEKDVNLRGAGVGATVIKSPAALTSYGVHLPDGRALTAIVRVGRGAHVRVSDLTVSGPIPCAVEVTGVHALQAATLELVDARVTGIQADPATCAAKDAAGRAVVFGTPPHIDVAGQRGTTAFGRVVRVTIDRYQHAGVSVAGPTEGDVSHVTMTDSVITGGWTLPSFQVGLWVAGHAVVQVHDNTINGNVCGGPGCGADPINEGQGIGVMLLEVPAGSRINDNRIAGNDVGISQIFSPDCCRIVSNTLVDNRYFGIIIQDGNGTTNANRIRGGQVGIGVVADALDTTAILRGDQITGTASAKVREVECCGYNATATVQPG